MSTNIDINKKYRTKGGRIARVICTDRKCRCPVLALLGEAEEFVYAFSTDGVAEYGSPQNDLIEIREPREFRVGVHIKTGNAYLMPEGAENPAYEFIRVREVIEQP